MPSHAVVPETVTISDEAQELLGEAPPLANEYEARFTQPIMEALLSAVSGAAASGSQAEILKHVLLQSDEEGNTALVATNTESSAIARTDEAVVLKPGLCLIPFSLLQKITPIAGEELTIKTEKNGIAIKSDESAWIVPMTDPDLFPEVPSISTEAKPIPTKLLLDALLIVAPAASLDESRPSLMMVKMEADGLYATDGGRAHFAALENEFGGIHIPSQAIKALVSILRNAPDDHTYIESNETHIKFLVGNNEFHARLLDAEFPSVDASIIQPRLRSHQKHATFSRLRMQTAIARAEIVSDGTVMLKFADHNITMIATSPTGGRSVTLIDATGYEGAPRQISYYLDFLKDAVKVTDTDLMTVALNPSPQDGSMLVSDERRSLVIMPRLAQ